MIELYLSTNKNITSVEIIDELMKTKVECQHIIIYRLFIVVVKVARKMVFI